MNTIRVIRTALLTALLVAAACVASAANAGEMAGLAQPGKFIVGLDDTFAPMGFRDTAGNLVGFDIDLAREVGRELGLEVVFQPVEWSAKEMELANKNIDCVWNGMSRTPEREKGMTLSKDYLNNRLVVMTNQGVALQNMGDMANFQIGTQAGSSSLEMVKKSPVYDMIKDNLNEYSTYDECILDMQAGRVQAMVVDEVLGKYKNNNLNGMFVFAPVDFGDDFYAIGFRRDADNKANDELCKAVEAAIQRVIDSGKGAEISNKWFGANLLLDMK